MWKAEKIELVRNGGSICDESDYLADHWRLIINGIIIDNSIGRDRLRLCYEFPFQSFECTFCGTEGCNYGGYLEVRKHDHDKRTGEQECPPHEWYEKGVLIVEKEMISELMKLLPLFSIADIREVSKEELDKILDWESLVKEKPKGFMVEE